MKSLSAGLTFPDCAVPACVLLAEVLCAADPNQEIPAMTVDSARFLTIILENMVSSSSALHFDASIALHFDASIANRLGTPPPKSNARQKSSRNPAALHLMNSYCSSWHQ